MILITADNVLMYSLPSALLGHSDGQRPTGAASWPPAHHSYAFTLLAEEWLFPQF